MAIALITGALLVAATCAALANVLPANSNLNGIGDCNPIITTTTGNSESFANGNFSNSKWTITSTQIINCKQTGNEYVTTFTSMMTQILNTTIISVNNQSVCQQTQATPFYDVTIPIPYPDAVKPMALSPTVATLNVQSRMSSNRTRGWHCNDPNYGFPMIQWQADLNNGGRTSDTKTTCNASTEVACWMPAQVSWSCIARTTYCANRQMVCFPPGSAPFNDATAHYWLCDPQTTPGPTPTTSPTPITTSNTTSPTNATTTTTTASPGSGAAALVASNKMLFGVLALVMLLALQRR